MNTRLHASSFDAGDDFIEEIFEVNIPGVERAYNASIVEYEGGYLMAFRYDTYVSGAIKLHLQDYCQYIGIVRLDKNFQPQGHFLPCLGHRTYDPRLFHFNGNIYLIFTSAGESDTHSILSSHLKACRIQLTSDGIAIEDLVHLFAPCQKTWEKNWVPFSYNNKIYLSYTIDPHLVLKPSLIDGTCEIISQSMVDIDWPFGIIRGGTPAELVDGQYLAFFHSSAFSEESNCLNYSIGAYIYSANPPFNLLKISPRPFFHPDFYSTEKGVLSKANILFPGGYVLKNEKIYLCYGENDGAIKIMVLNKKVLYKSMSQL